VTQVLSFEIIDTWLWSSWQAGEL